MGQEFMQSMKHFFLFSTQNLVALKLMLPSQNNKIMFIIWCFIYI